MSDFDSNVPEGFRQIPGYPRYAINEHGTILSVCRIGTNKSWADATRLTLTKDKLGYLRVCVCHDGHTKQTAVHILVLTAFVGPCPDGMQCRHIDGNPSNNHVSNLAWDTPRANQYDRVLHGTDNRGEKCVTSKLTEKDVLEIRRRATTRERYADIGSDFGVTRHNISIIVRRLSWKHV